MNYLNRRKIGFDMLKLSSGTFFINLIAILTTPFLTRIYEPIQFGQLEIFLAITGFFGAISCMRYEKALVLPKSKNSAKYILVLCLLISLTFSLITSFLLYKTNFLNIQSLSFLKPLILFFSINIFLIGSLNAFEGFCVRERAYLTLATSQSIGTLFSSTSKLISGLLFKNIPGLILGTFNGLFIANLCILYLLIFRRIEKIRIKFSIKRLWILAKRYRKFPIYGLFAQIFGNSSWTVIPILIAIYFDTEFVAIYIFSLKFLELSISLLGNSLSMIFLKEGSNKNNISSIVNTLISTLFSLTILPYSIVIIIGPEIFKTIFGSYWEISGHYAQILTPFILFTFLTLTVSEIFNILQKQKTLLILNGINLSIRIISIFVGYRFSSFDLFIQTLGILGFLVYLYKLFLVIKLSDNNFNKIIIKMSKSIFEITPYLFIIFILKFLSINNLLLLIIASTFVALDYWKKKGLINRFF